MKLAFIGGGMMGEAIIAGAIANDVTDAGSIAVCDVAAARRKHLSAKYGVTTSDSAAEVAGGADTIVLAVKPQEFAIASKSLGGSLKPDQTVMSIMAGVTIATIARSTGHEGVVRAIPNTPSTIGEGMTVWTATPAVDERARGSVKLLLSVLGKEIYVEDEKYVDMATAVSSSGPAYIFLVMEAMIDAAVHIGLRREMAMPIVLQTMLGSARYAVESGRHPAELRNQVTSPGGTTTEGLLELEESGLRAAFLRAVEAAYEKAKELGG
ncbi:MAG TPA: pyrroline-5-carboxylate reductase [Dehalococcoidia bacterium]|nr:pyrroline-5-carboxylate reductase [Dehalococcoidia bacterium]